MNRLRHSFAAVLAVLGASHAVAQDAEVDFRIGTWNLEFLGAEGSFRNNLPPRTEADYKAIGKKIVDLGVAVLAVQEICGEEPLKKVAAGAGRNWTVLLGTTGGWDDGKTAQNIGFLYDRSAVDLLSAEELLQLPREFEGQAIFHRVPVTACFRHRASGCDFRLVTVHLKAGQKPVDEQKRRGEAQALAGWLDGLHTNKLEDTDVVLLGDFNSTYGTDPERLFEHSKLRRYLQTQKPTPTIMHFAEPIDQIVGNMACRELRVDSLTVDGDFDGQTRETWRQTYSDHFPVTATLVARGDDDPQATFARGDKAHWLPRTDFPPTPIGRPPAEKPVGGPPGNTPQPVAGPWPPAVGAMVSLTTDGGQVQGHLLQPVPVDAVGWIVLRTKEGTLAVPAARVTMLRVH